MSTVSSLPPTVNSLDPLQRSRLLRSARKLGDVLGATPLIIDPCRSFAASVTSFTECVPETPRTSSVTQSSGSPPNKHKKHGSRQLARPVMLFLSSLPPIPKPPSSRGGAVTSQDENDVATIRDRAPAMPPSQDITLTGDAEKLLRRRRMAKLARTLGENIPPELVFPQHRKSRSEPPPDFTRYDREREKLTVSTGAENLPTHDPDPKPSPNPNPNPKPTPSSVPSDVRAPRHRSLAVGTQSNPAPNLQMIRRPSTSDANSRREAPFSSVTDGPVPMSNGNTIRDWRGEWSIEDSEQRAMVLRNLKG
ncbi:hypothetical protein F5887DRAFT_945358 [Amanita rubescens]|nr:hypothetical protein F5887DRAFT_945358 [Amanita rubescens]